MRASVGSAWSHSYFRQTPVTSLRIMEAKAAARGKRLLRSSMPFTPVEVSLQEGGPDRPYHWFLNQPLTLTTHPWRQASESYVIPQEWIPFETDLASVPRFLTWLVPRYGRYTKASLIHDYLCSTADPKVGSPTDRFKADEVFREAMRELKVGWVRRWMMWGAVTWATIVPAVIRKGRWIPTFGGLIFVLWLLTRRVWHAPPWSVFRWDAPRDLLRYALFDTRLEWWWALIRTVLVVVPSVLSICFILNPSVRMCGKMLKTGLLTFVAAPFLLVGFLTQVALICFWLIEMLCQPSLAIDAFRRRQVESKTVAAGQGVIDVLMLREAVQINTSVSPKTRRIAKALS